MGPIILDLTGLELSPEERELIKHPQVGGIIFFSVILNRLLNLKT